VCPQCLAVEEVARIDPSVAVMIDIQNTLLITAFMRYGTPEQKTQYLTRLCTDTVCRLPLAPRQHPQAHSILCMAATVYISADTFVCRCGSFCLTEPASGSDAFALKTRYTNLGPIKLHCAHCHRLACQHFKPTI